MTAMILDHDGASLSNSPAHDPASALIGLKLAFVTAIVGGQRIGLPIADVQDVLSKQEIQAVPLAPPAVVGALNLRGKIVTALDFRVCLGLEPCADPTAAMGIVVDHNGELYNLLVDEIGDVASPAPELFERPPATLTQAWRSACAGIYRLEDTLLLTLDIPRLLASVDGIAASQ